MAEYEPDDSRIVTNNPSHTPIEPERTGPKEAKTRTGGDGAQSQHEQADGSSHEPSGERDRWQAGEGANKEQDQ